MNKRANRVLALGILLAVLYVPTIVIAYLAFSTEYEPTSAYEHARFLVLLLIFPILCKYILQLFIAPFYCMVERRRAVLFANGAAPSISVVIPAWNEEVGILKTIHSVLETHYPALEIIVVNDGSTDRTHEVVCDFLHEYREAGRDRSVPIRYCVLENGGKARALNHALTVASNELFVTIDADSIMRVDALRNFAARFLDRKVACVAGNVVIGNHGSVIGILQQLEYLYGFYFKRADSIFNAVYIVGGAAAAYRRDVLRDVGGFDERMITEDIEISTRLQRIGHHVRYAADAIVFTEAPSDFVGLCRQRLRWKYGRLLTFIKHRALFFSASPNHRQYLTWIVLPIALFSEILLLFEPVLVGGFYVYTIYTKDYDPLLGVIVLLAAVVMAQIHFDPHSRYHRRLMPLAPGAWLVFYVVDAVEYQALVRSLYRMICGKEVVWQRWQRVGISLEGSSSHVVSPS